MEKSQKNCSSIFADPLGVNKIVSESEGETENSEKYRFSQLSPVNSKCNVEKEEENNAREFLLSKGFVPFQKNKMESKCFKKNNIIYHNVIPTTFYKRVLPNNTIPDNHHSTTHTTPNELVVTIDSPEKHSSFLESFVTFRVVTQTCHKEFMKSINDSSSPSRNSRNSSAREANKIFLNNKTLEKNYKANSNKVENFEVKFPAAVDNKVALEGNKKTEGIEVRRRFNDFLWLRQQLESCHPTLFIPPLPERHKVLDKFSGDFLNSRMVALSRFLNRLAHHPIISLNPSFILFLTSKQWEFKLDMSKKNDRPNELGGVINKISQSWHTINMKTRPMEFEEMGSRLRKLEEKLKISEKIVAKMQKEHKELLKQLQTLHPSMTLWAANESRLSPLLSSSSSCIASQSHTLHHVLHDTETRVLVPIKEYVMFLQAIKTVMRRRDTSQLHYERLCEVYESKKHCANTPKEDLSKAFEDMESYYDKHSCIEADLRAELDRFSTNQKRELKSIFKIFSENQMRFYKSNAALWDGVLRQSKTQKEEAFTHVH